MLLLIIPNLLGVGSLWYHMTLQDYNSTSHKLLGGFVYLNSIRHYNVTVM